jgi:hypothetical protein
LLTKSIDWIRVVHKELHVREIVCQSKAALFERYETKSLQDMPDMINKLYNEDVETDHKPITLYQELRQFEALGVKVRFKKKDK